MKNIPKYTILFCCLFIFLINMSYLSWFRKTPKFDKTMYYVGNGVILTLDIEEGTITAESKEIYDVPKDISEEQIWKMHQSIVDRNIQSYTAWISTGKITKRKPVYFLSIEDQERQATIDTPFIDIDTQTGKMLLGGHPVEQDSNSVVESFVLYPKESLYDKPRPLRINLEIIDINTP